MTILFDILKTEAMLDMVKAAKYSPVPSLCLCRRSSLILGQ